MNIYVTYAIIFMLLLVFELLYFNIAEKFNIVDKPNKTSYSPAFCLDISL